MIKRLETRFYHEADVMMFYTKSVASIIYNMNFFICNETDHDSKTFGRNLGFDRENPQLLNQSE